MQDDISKLNDWLTPLISKLDATQRKKLMTLVGRDLRRRNQIRIKQQVDADGKPFAPRLRSKRGNIKRSGMFTKLRTAKFMKVATTQDLASVYFAASVARIAEVHQYGLRDKVSPDGPTHNYAERALLGFAREDHTHITDLIINHLASGTL